MKTIKEAGAVVLGVVIGAFLVALLLFASVTFWAGMERYVEWVQVADKCK